MRQWELFGITDSMPSWTPPGTAGRGQRVVVVPPARIRERAMFLWSTDASLRLKAVSDAAVRLLGMDPQRSAGREILDVFGMEGENLAVLEAHTAALSGQTSTFTLEGSGGSRLRCRVAPSHDGDERVIGTFTIARREPREPLSPPAHLVGAKVA